MSDRKDSRRIFTDAQKAEILASAGYQCQGPDCSDRDLRNKGYQFHHVAPHSEGGLTSIYNAQVLCIECHKAIHKTKLFSAMSGTLDSVWSVLREWQKEAFDRYVENDDQRVFALEAAPGAGKTLFAAVATRYELDNHPEITHVICIAPWKPIIESMRKSFGSLLMEVRDGFHYDRKAGILQRPPLGDVTLDTYAGFCKQDTVDVLRDWIERYQFRFMLILDEVHHTNICDGSWGPFATAIAEMASKVLVMSGTYFRSDNKAISFLSYEDNRPVTNYRITYSECVQKRYVRQVAFRVCDPQLEFYSASTGKCKTIATSRIPKVSSKMLAKAKKEILDPQGLHVGWMINEAWTQLQMMRKKWPDAACLVVCQPKNTTSSEVKMVHAVAKRIAEITGCIPPTVTCDDKASHNRITSFRGTEHNPCYEPFLCAVRMVSEGVDIPRIRMVLFLSYTDSEMLFRQIVGRCIRYINGKEDDTAACVVYPRFPVMSEFAERFEAESKQGQLLMEPVQPTQRVMSGEEYESSACLQCASSPCVCFEVVGSEIGDNGGQFGGEHVHERFIRRAKVICDSSSTHQHANVVQLADILQRDAALGDLPVSLDLDDCKEQRLRNVRNTICKIALHGYRNDVSAAYTQELHHRFNVNTLEEIRATWRLDQIATLETELRNRLREVLVHGGR